MSIKLMLVDDHPLFMEGLQYLLETHGVEILASAQNGREALEKARIFKPDVILMDIKMPECSGIDALRLIKAEMPDIKVVMLTASEEDEDLFGAIKYGASGYLLKSTNAGELIGMLSDIEKNEVALSPSLAAKVLEEFRCGSVDKERHSIHVPGREKEVNLTERQLKILEMVAKGVTYKEAGDALGITERTLKYHMGRIIELLHLENRAQVIAYAARIGLVKDEG